MMLWSLLAFLILVAVVFVLAVVVFHLFDPVKGLRTVIANVVVSGGLTWFLDAVGHLAPYFDFLGSVNFSDMLDAKRAAWLTVGVALANVYFRQQTTTAIGRPQ